MGYDIALRPGTDVPVGTVATVLRPEGKPLGNRGWWNCNTTEASASKTASRTSARGDTAARDEQPRTVNSEFLNRTSPGWSSSWETTVSPW